MSPPEGCFIPPQKQPPYQASHSNLTLCREQLRSEKVLQFLLAIMPVYHVCPLEPSSGSPSSVLLMLLMLPTPGSFACAVISLVVDH